MIMSEREQARRVAHNGSRIPRLAEVVGFAKPRPPYICRSRAGRWRTAHELDGDQRVCIFCDRKFPEPPLH